MSIILKTKEFIKKLQELPLQQRKIILWVIVVIIAIVLFSFWLITASRGLKGIDNNMIKDLPTLEDNNSEINNQPVEEIQTQE